MNQPTRLKKIIHAVRNTANEAAASLLEIFQAAAPGHAQPPAADAHIYELLQRLCGNDPEHVLWVMRWLAFPLRNPGARMSTALVVNGPQGCGKDLFFVGVMGKIHERRALVLSAHLRSRFIDVLKGKRYVVVNDEVGRQDMARIKSLITSGQLMPGKKTPSPSMEENSLNFVFLSGADFCLNLQGSRRFFIVDAAPPSEPDFHWAVKDEINGVGIDAFHHRLMNEVDMSDFCRHAPVPRDRYPSAA